MTTKELMAIDRETACHHLVAYCPGDQLALMVAHILVAAALDPKALRCTAGLSLS